jgi:hypothetical protein
MQEIPSVLNTKDDVVVLHAQALAGIVSKSDLKQKLQDLLSDDQVWFFKEVVAEVYTPGINEKVMTQKETDDTIKYVCFELRDNPSARFLQMGFQRTELEELIGEL